MKRRDEVVLTIESAAYEGAGVGRVDNQVVFIPYAVPGDKVRAIVTRKKKRYLEASLLEVLNPSQHRIEPRCQYFGICGGCTWQAVDYDRQLSFKREQVKELLARIGGLKDVEVKPALPSPQPFYYRNKMEFSFGTNRWLTKEEIESGKELDKGFALGLHVPRRFDKIVDLEVCYLQSELTAEIVNRVRQLARSERWTCYNSRTNTGYLKNLVLRTVQHSEDMMVNLVTTAHEPDRLRLFTETLLSGFPQIKTILNSINPGRSPVAAGELELISYGDGTIRESLGGLSFEIGPASFFQPNTLQAERMFSSIAELGHLEPGHTVYDLFCGLGTIGQYIANRVEKVVGVENNESSVDLARKNCGINNLDNCVFEVGDAADALHPDFVARYGRPDRLILDPPRPGLHPQVCDGILREGPERIVYTSCNPATQARDLKLLSALYTVEEVHPIDMFPQTYHIESVAALQRRN